MYLASVLVSVGIVLYAIEMFRGRAQPNRVSWLLWGVLPIITWLASISEGAGASAILALALGVGALVIFGLSFFVKQAYWKTTRLDIVCGGCSVLAIAVWAITQDGNVAIALLIVADFLAAAPTIVKSYREPESEHALTYVLSVVGALITILTINVWTFANAAFSIYIFLVAAAIVTCLIVPRRRVEAKSEAAEAEA